MRSKSLTDREKSAAIFLFNEGYTQRSIAKILDTTADVIHYAVHPERREYIKNYYKGYNAALRRFTK